MDNTLHTDLTYLAEDLEIYIQGMQRNAPVVANYDEINDRVSILRMEWHSYIYFLQDCKKRAEEFARLVKPADQAEFLNNPKLISLKLERIKRRNKNPERMKPL
ncbi:MAG: hypothetical protein SFW64_00110 [Alphaproteobacteria bacterium]|nr:hypothetical protein [Alphaproteobacteria bacterium]